MSPWLRIRVVCLPHLLGRYRSEWQPSAANHPIIRLERKGTTMDDQRFRAFLVGKIVSAQATIDAIRADLENPEYLERMTELYAITPSDIEGISSDKIEYQKDFIVRAMERLQL
jgi:hypothetical protein